MLEITANGAGAAAEAAAGREGRRAVGEVGFGAGGRDGLEGVPDPELVEQAKRRSFTAEYKLRILTIDTAGNGEVAPLVGARLDVAPVSYSPTTASCSAASDRPPFGARTTCPWKPR